MGASKPLNGYAPQLLNHLRHSPLRLHHILLALQAVKFARSALQDSMLRLHLGAVCDSGTSNR